VSLRRGERDQVRGTRRQEDCGARALERAHERHRASEQREPCGHELSCFELRHTAAVCGRRQRQEREWLAHGVQGAGKRGIVRIIIGNGETIGLLDCL
jgi:hypothetical protein